MQKQTTYQQLQPEDRITIASMRQRGIGVRAIARTLERAPSTIARVLAHNTAASQDYGSHHAQLRAAAGRRHADGSGKLHVQSVCWGMVKTMLAWKWSLRLFFSTRGLFCERLPCLLSSFKRKQTCNGRHHGPHVLNKNSDSKFSRLSLSVYSGPLLPRRLRRFHVSTFLAGCSRS
jgi:hypothetical protein